MSAIALAAAATTAMTVGLKPTMELPVSYRSRWSGETADAAEAQKEVPLYNPSGIAAEEPLEEEACIIIGDKELGTEESVCGTMSFDSSDDGMVCVETPDDKWVCN